MQNNALVEATAKLTAREAFAELQYLFQKIAKNSLRYQYMIADCCIEFVFPNTTLVNRIIEAFSHLKHESVTRKSDLRIYIWDVESTNCTMPNINWDALQLNGYYGGQEGSIFSQYFAEISAISMLNVETNTGLYIVRSEKLLPWWISGSPLQVLLNWWFIRKNLQLTHAGAIANENGGVVVTGRGGSGKSTTVLTCVEQGMSYLSEDYCVLSDTDIPNVYSIYSSAKLEPNTLKKFPHYEERIINKKRTTSEKSLLFYNDIFPNSMKSKAPIKAIVALSVTPNEEPTLRIETDKAKSLSNLMSSTAIQLPGCNQGTYKVLSNIVSKVNCYRLELGTNLHSNVALIKGLLS